MINDDIPMTMKAQNCAVADLFFFKGKEKKERQTMRNWTIFNSDALKMATTTCANISMNQQPN